MMEEQQRLTLTKVIQEAIKGSLIDLHTATVAKVTAVTGTTISCKPVVSRNVGGVKKDLPVFTKVPVVTLQGGTCYTLYPVSVGDYCLLIFAERCLDNWKAGIDNELPPEYRMHDYSDGFALVGVNPTATAKPIPTEGIVQVGNMLHTGNLTIAGNLIMTGNLAVTGNIVCTGTMTVAGLEFAAHVHPIEWTDPAGSGTSGTPQ